MLLMMICGKEKLVSFFALYFKIELMKCIVLILRQLVKIYWQVDV